MTSGASEAGLDKLDLLPDLELGRVDGDRIYVQGCMVGALGDGAVATRGASAAVGTSNAQAGDSVAMATRSWARVSWRWRTCVSGDAVGGAVFLAT